MPFRKVFFARASVPGTGRLTLQERVQSFAYLPQFCKLVWQVNRRLVAGNILLRLVQAVLPFTMLVVGKQIVDHIVLALKSHPPYIHPELWQWIGVECALTVLSGILWRLIVLTDNLLGNLFANHTTLQIMSHAATLDLNQLENAGFYDKLERARQQSGGRTLLLSQILGQIQEAVAICFLSAGLVFFNGWLLVLMIVSVVPGFVWDYYFNGKHYALTRRQTHDRRMMDYYSQLGASDETAKELRVFNLSPFFINRFKKLADRLYQESRRLAWSKSAGGILLNLVGVFCYYGAYIYIIRSVVEGRYTLGSLAFLAGSFVQLKTRAQELLIRFNQVSQGAVYLKDFFEFFQLKPTIAVSTHPRPFPQPIQQGFAFEHVGYKYEQSTEWAIKGISFHFHPGEKIALIGENGAGKTTLVKLLARLYDPTQGRILLDGYDLRDYDVTELRMHIGVIFQDFLHYHLTSAENIAMGHVAEMGNHERIRASARSSLAHSIIDKLPHKYNQVLGRHFEEGIELSGGEWQKIALARAYMRDAQLFILDEPTAALDARSEGEVFQRFADLTRGKSVLLISHRFSTVRMADRILVLQKGELIEDGSHHELIHKNGLYAELFNLQAMAYK